MPSQTREDAIIHQLLGVADRRVFLDLGANNGITNSNTSALRGLGWRGILVEGSPVAFAHLQQNVPQSCDHMLVHAAIGAREPGRSPLVAWMEGSDTQLSTLDPAHKVLCDHQTKYRTIMQPTIDPNDLMIAVVELRNNLWGPSKSRYHFDLVSIDLEGAPTELAALAAFAHLEMGVVCVETTATRVPAVAQSHGYRLHEQTNENWIFVNTK